MPARVAVPLPLSTKVIPAGRAPVSVMAGAGSPVVYTVALKAVPTMELAELALMMVGATCSVRVSDAPAAMVVQVDSSPP